MPGPAARPSSAPSASAARTPASTRRTTGWSTRRARSPRRTCSPSGRSPTRRNWRTWRRSARTRRYRSTPLLYLRVLADLRQVLQFLRVGDLPLGEHVLLGDRARLVDHPVVRLVDAGVRAADAEGALDGRAAGPGIRVGLLHRGEVGHLELLLTG